MKYAAQVGFVLLGATAAQAVGYAWFGWDGKVTLFSVAIGICVSDYVSRGLRG